MEQDHLVQIIELMRSIPKDVLDRRWYSGRWFGEAVSTSLVLICLPSVHVYISLYLFIYYQTS
jgi:hypothetical protein